MLFIEDRLLIFWNSKSKEIPPRPQRPEQFPEDDGRHWYDMEYAGWGIQKRNTPESPGDGPQGKRVIYLQPGTHPYHLAYADGLIRVAEKSGVNLQTLSANMTVEAQEKQVRIAMEERPDLVILVPINSFASTRWVKEMNARGIPVIVSNYLLDDEAYRYILAWCGPDDWGQFRMLARKFAELMGYEGGYAIVRHMPGTSCYYARTWSIITELREAAPNMRCLAMSPAGGEGEFDAGKAARLVTGWLRKFGARLKGIVCADDDIWMTGINKALEAAGREDVIRVGAGSTLKGMHHVKAGNLHAITFQSAQADGALPMKVAVDWFNGLAIEPINYLPKYIITRENVDDFLLKKPEFASVSLGALTRSILGGNEQEVDRFFDDAYRTFLESELVTLELFRGFSIEVLSTLIHILKINDLDEQVLFSDYESLYKNLFNQKTSRNTIEWMKKLSRSVIRAIRTERQAESRIHRIVRYVTRNYSAPLSLKVLAYQFNISAPYLGRLFRNATGKHFVDFLHELRLKKAEEMLRYTALKESEIAERIGYVNVNYFYTLFKKYRGCYPSELKKRM